MATHAQAKQAGTPTWLDLMSTNAEEARTFYGAVLGWTYDIGGPEFGNYTTAKAGGRQAAGIVAPSDMYPAPAAVWQMYIASDDAVADTARAEALGATVAFPVEQVASFGTMATCQDTVGAMFSFWQANQHMGTQITGEPGGAAWYELYTDDADSAVTFYGALMDATATRMPDMHYYVLNHGDEQICGIMQMSPPWGGARSQWVIYFAVADIAAAVATAQAHGGRILDAIEDSPFGRLATIMDPQGGVFKLLQPPA